MRDKYGTRGDPACYPGTDVLINKLGLRDAGLLAEAEAAFAATAAEGVEFSGPPYDLAYLCRLHRQLFEEVYEWAGEIRGVDVTKGLTRFCTATRISPEADRIFSALALALAGSLQGLDRRDLVGRAAALYDELNVVHPFREGNGRALRLLFEHLILSATAPNSRQSSIAASERGSNSESVRRSVIGSNLLQIQKVLPRD